MATGMTPPAEPLPGPVEDPDHGLIARMAACEAAALRELYSRHGPDIHAYLWSKLGNRPLAEEVLQDVMLAAWQGASGFRGESRVRTWLFTIAHNRALNAMRRKRPAQSRREPDTIAAPPAPEMEQAVDTADLRAALSRLPANQRATLQLVFAHGLSMSEVATVMGVPPGTVKSRLHRAKRALRRSLEGERSDV